MTFLGILIDSHLFQLRLPQDKLARLRGLVQFWQGKKSCTRKELESFVGQLAHAATVIRPGRIFLRHLFALLSGVSNPRHFIRLNLSVRADLQWWACFLQLWNGSSFFPPPVPSIHIYSDAAGSFGCGAVDHQRGWFQVSWPASWSAVSIAVQEFVPVVIAAALWGPEWSGQHICFHSDNMAVVSIVNKRTTKHPSLNNFLRCLFFYSAFYKFHFSAAHIPGKANVAADAISRDQLHVFHSLAPQVQQLAVPLAIQNLLILKTPDWSSSSWTDLFCHSLHRESHPTH